MQGNGERGTQVPEIRFGGFSEEWEVVKLGEYAKFRRGSFPQPYGNKEWYGGEGSLPFVQVVDVTDKLSLVENTKQKISVIAQPKSIYVEKGKVLVTLQGSIGRVAIAQYDCYVDRTLLIFELFEQETDSYFWAYLIQNKFDTEKKKAPGGTIKTITKEALSAFLIKLSEYKEQTKIGNFFQQIDRLISQHQQKHDKLLNIKKALLEKMFPQPGKTEPEIRFKGFSEEWKTEPLEENADFSKGQGYSKSDLVVYGSPIILYGRLYTKYETVIFKVDTFVIDNGKSIISKGIEVIVPASGETADDIAIASAVVVPGILLGGDLNIIYPDKKINSIFLALSISNGNPRKDLSRRAQGKSVVHVRNSDLKELNISYPDVKEQTKIGNFFQQLDRLINQHQTQIQKLNHLKQAFLSKMFV